MKLLLKYREVLLYLFFGVLTTVVNIIVFQGCRLLNINLFVSNLIAWIVSVLVAFMTNKVFVFESTAFKGKVFLREICLFFGARVLSLVIDMAVIGLMVQVLLMPELISKIVSNVIVIVVNYILSKLIIFKK